MAQPGGAALYASAFLSQLFYHAWLGALVVTAQVWLFGVCLAYLLRAAGIRLWRLVHFVPTFLLLAVYCQHLYYVPTTVALLLALMFACVHVRGSQGRGTVARLILFVVLSGLCYGATGGAFLIFALVCSVYEVLDGRQRAMACVYTLIGLGVPYGMGVLAWGVDTSDAYTRLLPIAWTLQRKFRSVSIEHIYGLYLLMPGLMAIGKFWAWQGPVVLKSRPGIRSVGTLGLAVAIAVSAVCLNADTRRKGQLAVDYYAAHRMWPQVIDTARTLPADEYVLHALNRALYHTNRLGTDLFKWPQTRNALLLRNKPDKRGIWASYSVALEMGLLNHAEHALAECLEGLGDRPMILRHLARINMAKGNLGTARLYLGALSQTLFHRSWAKASLARLDSDPNLASDQDVQYLRSVALDKDVPSLKHSPAKMMEMLLKRNPENRMAFEYLLTYYMLHNRLVQFAEYIELAENMDYALLPTHFEEAMLVYVYAERKPLGLRGFTPDTALRKRLERFIQIRRRGQRNPGATRHELAKEYRGTYFFYNAYGAISENSRAGTPKEPLLP